MAFDTSLFGRRRRRRPPVRRRGRRRGNPAPLLGAGGGGGGGSGSSGWVENGRSTSWTEPGRASSWTAPSVTILVKRAAESRLYSMDFANLPEIAGGGALAAVTSVTATPAGLTVGTGTIAGTKVQVTISGGTDGVLYQVAFTATTNANPAATLVGIGYLLVDDQ
jgi:hypothetical protein